MTRNSKSLVFLSARTSSFRGPGRQLILMTPSHSLFSAPAASSWFLIPMGVPRAILRPNMVIVDADISSLRWIIRLAIASYRSVLEGVPQGAAFLAQPLG